MVRTPPEEGWTPPEKNIWTPPEKILRTRLQLPHNDHKKVENSLGGGT